MSVQIETNALEPIPMVMPTMPMPMSISLAHDLEPESELVSAELVIDDSSKIHEPNILNIDEGISSIETDPKVIYLDKNKTSYIKISHLPDSLKKFATDNFDEMFNQRPKDKHKIILRMDQVEVYRYQQSYLNTPGLYDPDVLRKKSYMFSGFNTSNNNIELPEKFKIFYDWIKQQDDRYNQVVANWYETGDDYIAYHSDCEIGMIPCANITMISLYGKEKDNEKNMNNYRTISFMPKDGVDYIYDKINIIASHGLVITMCGEIQSKFRHGIEKTNIDVLPRIGLSFRQYQ